MGAAIAGQICLFITIELCKQALKVTNEPVDDSSAYDEPAPAAGGAGQVFVLITALDYKQTSNALTCSIDGRNMERLVRNCGIPDGNVTAMYDEQCTKENVSAMVQRIGRQCQSGDYFIFYYSGHGTNLEDISGDEEDGQDEAFCFVTPDGQINYDSCMADDDFSDLLTGALNEEVKILILTDCCHSGTIADFETGDWAGRQAISITGCLDGQTSGDIGRGGIFTHSMLMAVGELKNDGEDDYSVGKLYNVTLEKDDEVFNSQQDITLQCAPGFQPRQMAWPLIPTGDWSPPYNRRQEDMS
mmetsp:Transcript_89669/g.278553  ORF Transcript_89669/g.278553 Transcript_89669/m.278553 type:complete len:301 (+) Transcript_89669:82-984(+)